MAKKTKMTIVEELMKATGTKVRSKEGRQKFLLRLVKAVSDMEEDDWNGLSEEAQDWVNEAITAAKAKKDITDPEAEAPATKPKKSSKKKSDPEPEPEEDEDEEDEDDDEDEDDEEDEDEDDDEDEEDEPPKKSKKKSKKSKPEPEEDEDDEDEDDEEEEDEPPKKSKKKKTPAKPRGSGCYGTALDICCKNPDIKFDKLRKMLDKKSVLNVASARTAHGAVRKIVSLLKKHGHMD